MKRARFTEEQIIAVLKEHEAGAKTADLARKCQRAPKFPQMWASKIPYLAGFGFGDQPTS